MDCMRVYLYLAAWIWICAPLAEANDGMPDVRYRSREISLDGHLDDWIGVSGLQLAPGVSGVRSVGEFGPNDLKIEFRAMWDEEGLYLAIDWEDDEWDVKQVRRGEAIFIDSAGRRRNRMHVFDNLMVRIKELDYDYTLWVSPRAKEQGPFYWQKLVTGNKALEAATYVPVIVPQESGTSVSLEIMLRWEQIGLSQKRLGKRGLPIRLLVSDSDSPLENLENKVGKSGRLEWRGRGPLRP